MKRMLRGGGAWKFLAVCALTAWAGAAAADSADEVIDANIKAIGGLENIKKITSIQRKGEVAVDGQFGQMSGTQEEIVIPGKKAFRNMDLGVFIQKMGWNGEVAWQDGMQGLGKIEGPEADQIKSAIAINPLVALKVSKPEGAKVEKLEDEKVGENDYHVLQLTNPGSETPMKLYINKSTSLLDQATIQQNNPQFGEVTITLSSADFQEYNGVKLPNKSGVKIGDILSLDTTFTETKVNEKVDESIFEMPTPPPPPPAPPAQPAQPPSQN